MDRETDGLKTEQYDHAEAVAREFLNLAEVERRRFGVRVAEELKKRTAVNQTACDPSMPRALSGYGGAGSAPTRGLTLDNVEDAFEYHPWHPGQTDSGAQVRDALVHAAKVILRNVPDSPDRSAGLRKIREARMDCNSAITHEGRF